MQQQAQTFSENEVDIGVRYARFRYGFTISRDFLRQNANMALETMKANPSLKLSQVRLGLLRSIRNNEERAAYAVAIGKMFAERSATKKQVKNHRYVPA
jgi:hypothetical protein